MRVLYLLVDETAPAADRVARRLREGAAVMPEGWTFDVRSIRIGPTFYEENAVGHAMATPGIVHATLAYQQEFDAVIIGCFGDPGLEAARAMARVQIVGPAEASFVLAGLSGGCFGIVTTGAGDSHGFDAKLAALGLATRYVGIEAIGLPVGEVFDDVAHTTERLDSAARRLSERGADAIVLGCMTFGFHPFARELQNRLGVPVIDPLRASIAALQAAETLQVRLGGAAPTVERPEEIAAFLDQLAGAIPVP